MLKKQTWARISRRRFVRLAAVVTPALALAACGEQTASLLATPAPTQPATAATTATTTTATTTTATTTAAKTASTTAPATSTATAAPASTTTAAAPASTTTVTAAPVLAATATCTSKANQTIAETEGPYFKPSSPERTSLLEAGVVGTKLTISGYVLSTDCKPVAGALVDFWQADGNGNYDNQGFKLRGHQYTDASGLYRLETVVPGLYPGRTRHIHVKVQAPNKPVLTTQLFFPGESRNQSDSIYNQTLLLQMQDNKASDKQGAFNFVLNLG